MKLNKIHGRNRYCGPAAISAITGCSTDAASVAIRKFSGKRATKGAHQRHVVAALRAAGVNVQRLYEAPRGKGQTFAQWRRAENPEAQPDAVFLIVSGWHYQVIKGGHATCGRIRRIVPIKDRSLKQRARVADVWRLSADTIVPPTLPKRAPDSTRSVRERAQRLAIQHGCSIDIDRGYGGGKTHYWVFGPDSLEDHPDYPFEGEHVVLSWSEVVGRIKDIAEFADSAR